MMIAYPTTWQQDTATNDIAQPVHDVVGRGVLLLMVVFRSVTVAIKAAVMNLLSISPPTACSPQSCNGVLAVWAGNTPGPRVWSGTSEGERQLLRSRGSDGMPGRRWCRARSLVRSACR